MKTNRVLRKLLATILGGAGVWLMAMSFHLTPGPATTGPTLAFQKINRNVVRPDKNRGPFQDPTVRPNIPSPNAPTFGHPVISGIGGFGYEENLRPDPTDPTRIYTSVPGSAAADTSWIWRSLDTGKTFKWVPAAVAFTGKVTTCNGGGDTELAVDSAAHLYFNDLTLANFSTSRSDDDGVSFTCSNTGVPDTVVDRQWYAVDGDPTNGGTLYLANDEVGPGGINCGNGIGGSAGNNVLVMYRSPAFGALGSTAGIEFGTPYHITASGSCDEGIMGNDEVSPIATKTGQPNGLGGYTQLGSAVKHIYVVHDNTALNQVRIGRCFPVAFGVPVANVSDPSGLNCTDLLVKDIGANARTGGSFPTMAIDKAGNLYVVWEQAPTDANSNIIGDTVLMYSYSLDEGNTWSAPLQIDTSGSPDGVLHNNVFAWIAAGDDGRVNIAWYGTTGLSNPNDPACGSNTAVPLPPPQPPSRNINGPDATTGAFWSLWFTQSVNAHAASPTFIAPVRASEHFNHVGTIQTLLGGQCGDRQGLGDFLQLRTGAQGEAQISYADSNNMNHTLLSHAMFVRQNSGTGLYAAQSPMSISGIAPYNIVLDQSGDGKYEVNGVSSANMPQLDIITSSVTQVTTAPCSVAAPCYRIFMQLNNLSLAPTLAQDPNVDLVWLTQWFVPSSTDPTGGRDFHVYAESTNGGALQCFTGQNAAASNGGGFSLSYPGGTTALPAPNCQSTLGPNGTITIYVPLSMVSEPGAIDNRLHEVTASTMTLTQPANSVQPDPLLGTGGSLFNLIDVAQGYVFDPILTGAVSRKVHGGAGPFDIDLLAGGVEDRGLAGGPNNYQVVVTFASPITLTSANVVPGSGGTASINGAPIVSGNQVTINLTNVSNAQRLTINLLGVNDGTITRDLAIPMGVLLGDTSNDGFVNAGDTVQVRAQAGNDVTTSTFRFDVNADGLINAGDTVIVRNQSGTALP